MAIIAIGWHRVSQSQHQNFTSTLPLTTQTQTPSVTSPTVCLMYEEKSD